jgi:hypothetical protein
MTRAMELDGVFVKWNKYNILTNNIISYRELVAGSNTDNLDVVKFMSKTRLVN